MGLLGIILSGNKRKWFSQLANTDSQKFGLVIKNFLIQDNINYDIFQANSRWDSNRLSVHQNMNDLRNCSPSYRRFYAEDRPSGIIEQELGYNDWFYLGYPDVAKWFEDNFMKIRTLLESKGVIFHRNDDNHLQILRFVVTMYQEKFGRLECGN